MTPEQAEVILQALQAKRDLVDSAWESVNESSLNQVRRLSVNHAAERAAGKEICLRCILQRDSVGGIVGATHYRLPIDDITVSIAGQPDRIQLGIRSMLLTNRANLDANGVLLYDGKPA